METLGSTLSQLDTGRRQRCKLSVLVKSDAILPYCQRRFLIASLPCQQNPAETQWGNYSREWDSLAHVWSEFYREYEQVDYPRLMIRFEGECGGCDGLSIVARQKLLFTLFCLSVCSSLIVFVPFFMINTCSVSTDVLFHTEKVVDAIRTCAGKKAPKCWYLLVALAWTNSLYSFRRKLEDRPLRSRSFSGKIQQIFQ